MHLLPRLFATLLLILGVAAAGTYSTATLLAQRFTFLTNGPIKERIPAIDGEVFSFCLIPAQQDHFPANVRLRWLDDAGNSSDWHEFERDAHGGDDVIVSELGFANSERWTKFELDMPATGPVTLYLFDPGKTPANHQPEPMALEGATCFQPTVLGRNDWCPAGNCPVDATPAFTQVTHLIVHHSAGSNTASDWSAVVRSIWDFHVNVNGWDDIGYNYLVDPNGVIYEGRGNNVRGAHFCGKNSNTMGTCLLGNFTDQQPTTAALDGLTELLSWKCDLEDINPLETTFHAGGNSNLINLAGHRDGCSTSCPGDAFYPQFDAFRQGVAADLINCINSSTHEQPAWAEAINVSPNPGNGEVRVNGIPTGATVSIYTLDGRLLASESQSQLANIEAMLTAAAPGVYFLRTELNGGVYAVKVIRQ